MSKRVRRNPYLIILFKRMLAYEFVVTEYEPNNLQLAHFIYDRHKSVSHQKTTYRDDEKSRDSIAYSQAERIRKHFLTPKNFDFSDEHLDNFIQEITELGQFSSWAEFENKYSNQPGALMAKREGMAVGYSMLSNEVKNKIVAAAQRDWLSMHYYAVRRKAEANSHLIVKTDQYSVRTANVAEIKDIEILAKRVYPCPINGFDTKKTWHDKNPYIFYIYKDDYGVWANLNLLPIEEQFYKDLKHGKRYEDTINKSDILSPQEKLSTQFIYIEGLACTVNHILPLFGSHLKDMINSIADAENENLVICAIGGSVEGDKIMESLGFEKSGTAIDPRDKKEYPFLEIKWNKMVLSLKRIEEIKDYFNNDNRLKAIHP